MKKLFSFLLFLPLLAFATPYNYTGEFQSISSNGAPCEQVFSTQKFRSQHFLTGPTHLTSVVNFRSVNNTGFFNNVNLVGNNDGWGRLRVDRELIKEGMTYKILADGMYDREFLLLDVVVEAFSDINKPAICKASAQFSAYQ